MLVNVLAPVTRHEVNGSPCDATVDDCWLSFDKPAVELINSSVAAAIPINTTRLMVSLPTNPFPEWWPHLMACAAMLCASRHRSQAQAQGLSLGFDLPMCGRLGAGARVTASSGGFWEN